MLMRKIRVPVIKMYNIVVSIQAQRTNLPRLNIVKYEIFAAAPWWQLALQR